MKRHLEPVDPDCRFDKLREGGDALKKLKAIGGRELLRTDIQIIYHKERKRSAGRRQTDLGSVLKMLVLQSLCGLSDDALQFQVADRPTFTRHLGICLGERVPYAKTVWLYCEQLCEAKNFEGLFGRFHQALAAVSPSSTAGRSWMRALWRQRGSAVHAK
jgi:hypothetical protein